MKKIIERLYCFFLKFNKFLQVTEYSRRNLILFFLISLLVLSFNYFPNIWGTAHESFYLPFQRDSEALVIGKILHSNKVIDFSPLGSFIFNDDKTDKINSQHYIFYENIPTESLKFQDYKSQYGLQGVFWNFIYKLSPIESRRITLFGMWFLNSIFLACVLSLFVLWVAVEWGWTYAIVSLVTTCGSSWLTAFGRNLYWVTFLWFIPLIVSIWYYRTEEIDKHKNSFWLFTALVISILIKSLCGYEYLSSIVLAACCPIVYYAVKNKWNFKRVTTSFIIIVSASIIGFIIAVTIHSSSMKGGMDVIINRFLSRTFDLGQASDLDLVAKVSVQASSLYVLVRYFFDSYGVSIGVKSVFLICLGFPVIFIAMFFSLCKLLNKKKLFDKELALCITFIFSILAPVSWHILMKGHSYFHTHMNYVLWHLPFTLYGYLLIMLALRSFKNTTKSL